MDASTTLSEPMRRVLDAMIDGQPVPPDAHEALTEAERQELAALARTAQITRLALQQPEPPEAVETQALQRAQKALTQEPPLPAARTGSGGGRSDETSPQSGWRTWLSRLFGRKND